MYVQEYAQTVSWDDFLPRMQAHSHTQFSAPRTLHARVRFAKIQGALAYARFNNSKFWKQIFHFLLCFIIVFCY